MHCRKRICKTGNTGQFTLCLRKQRCSSVGLTTAIETFHRGFNTVGNFLRVLQKFSALFQDFILTDF